MAELTTIGTPYLLFLGDVRDDLAAKTAFGIRDWRPEHCLGELRLPGCVPTLGLPAMTPEEASLMGARTMVIGCANSGGVLPDHWVETILRALAAGLDVASGLHMKLADNPHIRQAAEHHGQVLHDVRHPTSDFATGTGRPRSGKRLLTVGTDCSVGKMYTSLAITDELQRRGHPATFRATGQTGILIAGSGVSVDAVVADFISGAVEALCPAKSADHWDVIEGQGSLFHPAFAGVSLGLLHGAQPDALVLCHEPTRQHMRGLVDFPLPGLHACLRANLQAARLTNPAARPVGIAVNTSRMDADDARKYLEALSGEFGLPAVDPLRHGVAAIVDLLEHI